MAEYINKQSLDNRLTCEYREYYAGRPDIAEPFTIAHQIVKTFPTEDTIRHAYWIDTNDTWCSSCGEFAIEGRWGFVHSDYCPHCGAMMDGKDGDSDG